MLLCSVPLEENVHVTVAAAAEQPAIVYGSKRPFTFGLAVQHSQCIFLYPFGTRPLWRSRNQAAHQPAARLSRTCKVENIFIKRAIVRILV